MLLQESPEAPFAKGGSAQRGGFAQVGVGHFGKGGHKLL
jgi:hypothetical protein